MSARAAAVTPRRAAALGAALLATPGALAQTAPCAPRPNALVADLGLHVINVGYQRALGCSLAVQASAGLYVPWTVNQDVLGLGDGPPPGDVGGALLRVRAFVYPLGRAPAGLWVSPFAQGGYVRGTRGGDVLPGAAFAAGVSAGWAWLLGGRWLVAVGAGAQYHLATFEASTARPGFSRFAPTLDLNVGYAF